MQKKGEEHTNVSNDFDKADKNSVGETNSQENLPSKNSKIKKNKDEPEVVQDENMPEEEFKEGDFTRAAVGVGSVFDPTAN